MKRIASFDVDHTVLTPGFYISRVDGDIVTYDMRVKVPNTGDLMTNSEMHSFEHMFTTYIRNGALAEDIIYCGPMGCRTGFYLLVRNREPQTVFDEVKIDLQKVLDHEGEVFGCSAVECGDYRSLSLDAAKKVAAEYLAVCGTVTKFTY